MHFFTQFYLLHGAIGANGNDWSRTFGSNSVKEINSCKFRKIFFSASFAVAINTQKLSLVATNTQKLCLGGFIAKDLSSITG